MSADEKERVAEALRNLERIRAELIQVADTLCEVILGNELDERVDQMIDSAIGEIREARGVIMQRWLGS